VDEGALLANIVEDRGKPGDDGSPDHIVALALEVVTVCLYFSSPQIPLFNGPGLATPAAVRGRPKEKGEVQMPPLYDKGQPEAGKELPRAANSIDSDVTALAWAMSMKGARRLRDLERCPQTDSRTILGGNYVDEIMRCL
jgi:hypothetical protein